MRTQYVFSLNDATFGELVYSRTFNGNYVYTVNHRDEMGTCVMVPVTVCEGETARRAFMNHFGDDSSWPPGWWDRIGRPQFTRKSWERENYPPSKVSWQEYFGVPSP